MQLQFPELAAQLQNRLLRGEHLTLYGPRGGGKSTLLMQLHARLQRNGVPCSYSPCTTALDHITRALEGAYPGVDTLEVARRMARVRLWNAADRRPGVLLLDHFRCNGSAMVSFLRRLHGKIAGVLTAVDIDAEKEHRRMRPWRYGAMSVRMPSATARQLRCLLDERWRAARLPPLASDAAAAFVEAARGRPGWIERCVALARERRYWREFGPLVTVVCVDTEAAVRYQALDLVRAQWPAGSAVQASSATAGGSAPSGLMTPKRAGRLA
jgi:predicted ATPase